MNRIGYGAMQLSGTNVWGLPDDPETARRVLADLGTEASELT